MSRGRDATNGETSAEATERMLPCPSCTSTDVDATFARGHKDQVNAGCMGCGMTGPDAYSAKDAADRWNELPRHAPPSETVPTAEYQRGLKAAWDAVDAKIVRGELKDHQAHEWRNGMVLASNIITEVPGFNWNPSAPSAIASPFERLVDQRMAESPVFLPLAIELLNTVKAWRDCDGNDGFPHETRERIDALLMAYELREQEKRRASGPAPLSGLTPRSAL